MQVKNFKKKAKKFRPCGKATPKKSATKVNDETLGQNNHWITIMLLEGVWNIRRQYNAGDEMACRFFFFSSSYLQLTTSESIIQMITFFLSSMSERPLVPLTAPLMGWRMPPSEPKCITITVIRDTCRLTWSPGDKHGMTTKHGMEIELGHLQDSR